MRIRLILHCQHEVQVSLVVHLSVVRQTLLIYSLDEDFSQCSSSKSCELVPAEHSVMICVEVEILTINPQSRWSREPILFLQVLRELLIPELQQVVQEGAGEDVLYLYL